MDLTALITFFYELHEIHGDKELVTSSKLGHFCTLNNFDYEKTLIFYNDWIARKLENRSSSIDIGGVISDLLK